MENVPLYHLKMVSSLSSKLPPINFTCYRFVYQRLVTANLHENMAAAHKSRTKRRGLSQNYSDWCCAVPRLCLCLTAPPLAVH